jgi:hypothetical protein
MRRTSALCGIVTLLALAVGCESQITGNEGNFQFSYPADDSVLDFNKPVAVGAYLDMRVREVGTQAPVELTSASFDDPMVLDVEDFSGNEVTITGTGAGGALLTVEGTTTGDEELFDSVNMLARVPEVHVLAHTCGDGADPMNYMVDQRVWVPFEFEMSNSQPVIGYGYYPLTLSDTLTAVNADESGQQYMAFDNGTTAGSVTMTSDIDASTLTMNLVEAASIDGIADPIAFVLEDIDVGDINPFYVLPEVAGVKVCQADVTKTVAAVSTSICAVTDRDVAESASGSAAYEFGWFQIEGLAEGTCEYTVTYPAGAAGVGVTEQFTFPIEP